MGHWTRKLFRTLAVLAALALTGRTALAQTPEGTLITNTATVSYTDANGNSYAPVSASVSVTVGFAGGVDVSGTTPVTPAAPSTGNVLTYTIQNAGNGTDSVRVDTTVSVSGVIAITGYRYNATPYASLALLNAALSAVPIAPGASISVEVLYDVPAGQGGATTNLTLTGTSRRDNTRTDSYVTTINPTESFGVAVTPDAQALQQLPTGSGSPYSVDFTVTNNGNGPEVFELTGSPSGAAIIIVSVNGVAGVSATLPSLAAGASATVAVVYTLDNVVATETLTLAAEAQSNPATTNDGSYVVTVIRPGLALTKQAWLGDRSAQISGPVLPGDFIEYRIQVSNTGDAAAASVVVTDTLPAEVALVSTEDPAGSWTSITASGGTPNVVTAPLSGSLAAGANRFFWIRVRVL